MTEGNKTLEEIAVFVHGVLLGMHCLGVYYHLRKRRPVHAAVHASVAVYDLVAMMRHRESNPDDDYLERLREKGL